MNNPTKTDPGSPKLNVDIADFEADYLALEARKTGDSTDLISFLRTDGLITPELRKLLSDVLEGSAKLRRKNKSQQQRRMKSLDWNISRFLIEAEIDHWMATLDNPDCEQWMWDSVERTLRETNFGAFDPHSKPDRTRAAERLVAHSHGLNDWALETVRYRQGKPAKGKKPASVVTS